VAPAIDAALQKINSHSPGGATSHWMHPNFSLTVNYADSMCDSAESLNHAIKFYMTGKVRNTICSVYSASQSALILQIALLVEFRPLQMYVPSFYPNVTTLRSVFAIANLSDLCLSFVCLSVRAPYSGS